MIEKLLKQIGEVYPLTEKDPGEYARLKASGMNFTVRKFEAEGLGAVSVMQAKGFFGLMKMDTLIVNPTAKDMPLLSYDRVLAMGNDTLIYEIYDTLLTEVSFPGMEAAKASGESLPAHDVGSHWYDSIKLSVSLSKKGKKKETPLFDELALRYMDGFLADSKNAPACEAEQKREKAGVYVEGLLTNGGPSTDVFKKAMGDAKTADLFRRVLFSTQV